MTLYILADVLKNSVALQSLNLRNCSELTDQAILDLEKNHGATLEELYLSDIDVGGDRDSFVISTEIKSAFRALDTLKAYLDKHYPGYEFVLLHAASANDSFRRYEIKPKLQQL